MKKICLVSLLLLATLFIRAQAIQAWKITDVVNYYSKKSDSIYVINFWATFCKPCVSEIPYLQSITEKYKDKKVKLLLVSLDLASYYPAKIAAFAKKNNFYSDIRWLNESNADYFCPIIDKKWSGAIPATLFVNAKTGYKNFFEAELSAGQFEAELKKAIGD